MLAYVAVVVAAVVVLAIVGGWVGVLVALPFAVMLGIFGRVIVSLRHDDPTI